MSRVCKSNFISLPEWGPIRGPAIAGAGYSQATRKKCEPGALEHEGRWAPRPRLRREKCKQDDEQED